MSETSKPDDSGGRLVFGGCAATLGVTASIIVLALLLFIDTTNCGALGRALPVLWGVMAVVFIASVVLVSNRARKVIADKSRRSGVVVIYAVMLLAIYIFSAFVLLVAFNC